MRKKFKIKAISLRGCLYCGTRLRITTLKNDKNFKVKNPVFMFCQNEKCIRVGLVTAMWRKIIIH